MVERFYSRYAYKAKYTLRCEKKDVIRKRERDKTALRAKVDKDGGSAGDMGSSHARIYKEKQKKEKDKKRTLFSPDKA